MDEITEALADQLTMKQDLNRGLMMSLSFYEEQWIVVKLYNYFWDMMKKSTTKFLT